MPFKDPEAKKRWRLEHKQVITPEQKARYRAASYRWSLVHPESAQLSNRKRQLKPAGWTPETYATAFERQGGRCAICGGEPKAGPGNSLGRLCGDHEHTEPPKPRDLLCHSCNAAVGLLKDSSAIAENAMVYLRKWDR